MISNMKVASLIVGALAAVAGAQDLSAFPQCAQWCINNMQQANKSQELGCAANDSACHCRNANFLYGVRDCSAQLCGSLETAGQAIGYTNDFCRQQGVDLASVTSGVPAGITNTNVPSGSGSGTQGGSASATATASGSGAAGGGASGSASASPISTSAIVSTVTENGSEVVTTIGSSTIFAGGAGGAGASGSAATSVVPVVSTVTSGDSTFATTVGSSTLTTQASGSATNSAGSTNGSNGGSTGGNGGNGGNGGQSTGAGGAATTTSNPNYAPQMTAAPIGMLAAAGVAAFLL